MADPLQPPKKRGRIAATLLAIDAWIDSTVYDAGFRIADTWEDITIFFRRFRATAPQPAAPRQHRDDDDQRDPRAATAAAATCRAVDAQRCEVVFQIGCSHALKGRRKKAEGGRSKVLPFSNAQYT